MCFLPFGIWIWHYITHCHCHEFIKIVHILPICDWRSAMLCRGCRGIQGPFKDWVLAVLTIFSLAIIENCSVLTSHFAVHAEGEKVGIIKDLRYWEAHSKAHSTDIVIWWKYLIETKLWMSECWLRCRFHSQESLRPSRGQSAQTLCSLSRAHTHTHTFTNIQTYKHTCILICTHMQTLL